MSTRSAPSGKKSSSNRLNRQVGMYSLAAAVAGVSVLALAEPAAGEVVVTKKTIPIPLAPNDMPRPVRISIANNGNDDFTFNLSSSPASPFNNFPDRQLFMRGVTPNDGVSVKGFSSYAVNLEPGARIGPDKSAYFKYGFTRIEESTSFPSGRNFVGYWGGNPKDRYLGVRFLIDGEFHYGWIRLTVTTSTQLNGPVMSAEITAYAYETLPNKPIFAGNTEKAALAPQLLENIQSEHGPSLGMLAAGAEGVPLWRGKRTVLQ